MAKTNEFTQVVQDMVKEISRLKKAGAKSPAVPFMAEKLSRSEARTRVQRMTPGELALMPPEARIQLVKDVGPEAVLEVLRAARRPSANA